MGNFRLVVFLILAQAAGGPDPAARPTPRPTPRRTLPAGVNAKVAPEPPLSPEEALRSFKVESGFRVEIVAAEPLVQVPVSMTWDPDGRLWVVEMPGFMPNVEGNGEQDPTGRVVILDDTDGDGRMDKRTVFLDGLVLPRSVALVAGGVLVGAPPKLLFCRDADKDDRCDAPEVVSTSYGTGANPEHDANGLVFAMDNWLYSANLGIRHRFRDGRWVTDTTASRGQWGIGQDDFGRLFYNTNGVYLRADFLPAYMPDAHVRGTPGVNVEIDPDQTTWPARPNTGINRAYNEGMLRPDGTLVRFTAACGPTVYRGDQFPEAFRGNAFVPEPAGNFVRRSVVLEYEGKLLGRNALEASEFLTSRDERFRPVNVATGPDGALYVVDMYRGLIQHRIYLTPFLREQIRERALDRPVDRGRIWRVVAQGRPLGPRPQLTRASPETLVGHLSHPNGWWRDTAQRLLVERGEKDVVPALLEMARSAADPRTRLHAFFALDGLSSLDRVMRDHAAADGHRFVRLAAASLVDREKIAALTDLAGELAQDPQADDPRLERAGGRELTLLARILAHPAWSDPTPARAAFLRAMASRLLRQQLDERTVALFELITGDNATGAWRQLALLEGVAEAKSGERATQGDVTPRGWPRLLRSADPGVRKLAVSLELWTTGRVREARGSGEGTGLGAAGRARFARGQTQYAALCGVCHHASGIGEKGKAPPLVESSWINGPAERLVRITLQGLRGPVRVSGRVYNMEMPPMGALTDEQIADILTYIRNEKDWGHDAGPVDPETVARIRQATVSRKKPWTAEELLALR